MVVEVVEFKYISFIDAGKFLQASFHFVDGPISGLKYISLEQQLLELGGGGYRDKAPIQPVSGRLKLALIRLGFDDREG